MANKQTKEEKDEQDELFQIAAKLKKNVHRGYPDKNPNHWKAFLHAYAMVGTITAAAQMAGICRRAVTKKLSEDPKFMEDFENAKEEFINLLETECYRRACEGIVVPVIHKGEVVEVWVDINGKIVGSSDPRKHKKAVLMEHKKSDLLMMFSLKSLRPNVYRDNQKIDITSDDKPIKAYVGINPDAV
jgi:hypothetical protein